MKLKNGDVYLAVNQLGKLMDISMPVIPSLQIAKLADKLQGIYRIIDAVRLGLVEKYGTKDKNGGMSVPEDSDNWDAFLKEYNELMEQEVEIVFDVVQLPANIEVEPSVLLGLTTFIEVKGEPQTS